MHIVAIELGYYYNNKNEKKRENAYEILYQASDMEDSGQTTQ